MSSEFQQEVNFAELATLLFLPNDSQAMCDARCLAADRMHSSALRTHTWQMLFFWAAKQCLTTVIEEINESLPTLLARLEVINDQIRTVFQLHLISHLLQVFCSDGVNLVPHQDLFRHRLPLGPRIHPHHTNLPTDIPRSATSVSKP